MSTERNEEIVKAVEDQLWLYAHSSTDGDANDATDLIEGLVSVVLRFLHFATTLSREDAKADLIEHVDTIWDHPGPAEAVTLHQ